MHINSTHTYDLLEVATTIDIQVLMCMLEQEVARGIVAVVVKAAPFCQVGESRKRERQRGKMGQPNLLGTECSSA